MRKKWPIMGSAAKANNGMSVGVVGTLVAVMVMMIVGGCGPANGNANRSTAGPAGAPETVGGELTIYCGRGESLVGKLLKQFETETGVKVTVVYDRTPVLATRLMTEREQTPADVFFAQDPGYLGALANAGLLAPLPTDILDLVDERMRDADGRWVGTSGRLRVLVFDPTKISREAMPKSLAELADPRYSRVGWAPGNGSFHAHVSVLRHTWGAEKTEKFLSAIKANGATAFDSNRPQVAAAAAGSIEFGWVNHYYLHQLSAQDRAKAENYSFPAEGDVGNVMMVSGVGVLKSSKNQPAGQALARFLLSESAQTVFAQENFEYPTRRGIATHPDVTPLKDVRLAPAPQAAMADVGPTIEMLQRLGLQ